MSLEKSCNGYQKGLQEGSEDSHEGWLQALLEVSGIGLKRFKQIRRPG